MDSFNLLISLCNNPITSLSQTVLVSIPTDFDTNQIQIAPLFSGFEKNIESVTGLSKDKENIYLVNPGKPSNLAVLNQKTFSMMFVQELPQVHDVHSLLADNEKLYIVSTGTDEVISYEILGDRVINPQVAWKASSTGKDTNHINSIINFDGDLLISAFGPKSGDLNSSARNGFIYNISKDIRIKENIFHPHTLSAKNDEIYFCESSLMYFCSYHEQLLSLDGYSRGIAWLNDDVVCIGTSIGRTVSRSTGQILNPSDPGERFGSCALTFFDISKKEVISTVDLSLFGPEIYDILLLDGEFNFIELASNAYFKERIQLNISHKGLVNQVHLNQKLNNELLKQKQEVLFYSQSKSWNLTRPLRKIRKIFHRKQK